MHQQQCLIRYGSMIDMLPQTKVDSGSQACKRFCSPMVEVDSIQVHCFQQCCGVTNPNITLC